MKEISVVSPGGRGGGSAPLGGPVAASDGLLAYWLMQEASGTSRTNGTGDTSLDLLDTAGNDVRRITATAAGAFQPFSARFIDSVGPMALTVTSTSIPSVWPGEAGCTAYTMGALVNFDVLSVNDRVLALGGVHNQRVGGSSLGVAVLVDSVTTNFSIITDAVHVTGVYEYLISRWNGGVDDEYSYWRSGVKQTTTHNPADVRTLPGNFIVGAANDTGSQTMNGAINEAFMFSRSLTDAEIAEIVATGISNFLTITPDLPPAFPVFTDLRHGRRVEESPFNMIHPITMNGAFNNTLTTALGTITSNAIDASQAHRVGFNYNVSAVTGTLDLTVSLEAATQPGGPFHTVNGEAGNTAVSEIENTSVSVGRRQTWWEVTAPIVRFKVTTANLGAGEAVSFRDLRAWTQS